MECGGVEDVRFVEHSKEALKFLHQNVIENNCVGIVHSLRCIPSRHRRFKKVPEVLRFCSEEVLVYSEEIAANLETKPTYVQNNTAETKRSTHQEMEISSSYVKLSMSLDVWIHRRGWFHAGYEWTGSVLLRREQLFSGLPK